MTIQEIQAEIEKQPELKTGLITALKPDFLKNAETDGLIVRTKQEDETFREKWVSSVIEDRVSKALPDRINEEFGKIMRNIDAEVLKTSGIEKKPGEKTTEYFSRVIAEKKTGGDPITKEKVTELENLLRAEKEARTTEKSELESKLFNREVEWQLNGVLDKANIAVPAHLKTDEEKNAFINQQRGLIKQGFLTGHSAKKDAEGNIIFYDGDKPQMSVKDGKPKTAGEILNEKFSAWFVPAQHARTGTGTGADGKIPEGGFKDKAAIHEHLRANGVEVGTKAYLDQLSKLASDSKIVI